MGKLGTMCKEVNRPEVVGMAYNPNRSSHSQL